MALTAEIQEKIQLYIKRHPELRLYNQETIISIMADEGVITKEDLANIKAGGSVFGGGFLAGNSTDFKEIFGGKFNIENTPKSKMNNLLKLAGLTMDTEGIVDTSHLTEEEIIKKFGKENCTVKRIKDAPKIFIEIKTGDGPLLIGIPKEGEYATTSIQLMESGVVIEPETNKVLSFNESDENQTSIYDIKGNIVETRSRKNGTYTQYENGYPYMQINQDGSTKNLLVEDLIKDITAKNWLGLPTTRDSIKDNVLKRITPQNANEVLEEYKQQTGNDLIKDIKNEWGLSSKLKDELINHIQTCSPKDLAQSLADDIYGLGSGNLDKDIKKINKDNVKEVIKEYVLIAIQKDNEFIDKTKDDFDYELQDLLLGGIGSGLIADIMDEWGLSESKQKEYVNHILNAVKEAMNEDKDTYYTDIKADIEMHKDDPEKLDIDIIRFAKRNPGLDNENFVTPNGVIDADYAQGHTGDCWLISGLSAILAKPKGKELLNSLIKTDPKTGDIIVTLKGIGKSLRVKADAIKNSNHLSKGDGDIRAIEIAVDWVLKQYAYQGDAEIFPAEGKTVDIDGNHSTTLFMLLFGVDSYTEEDLDKIKQMDFNKPNSFNTVGFGVDEPRKALNTPNIGQSEVEQTLITSHAYSILKEDEKYIYLYDPNIVIDTNNIAEENIIKRTKEEFYKLNPCIMGVNV